MGTSEKLSLHSEETFVVVDPPEGWRYGFPKLYENPEFLPLDKWLIENGYPIDKMEPHVVAHTRWWFSSSWPDV